MMLSTSFCSQNPLIWPLTHLKLSKIMKKTKDKTKPLRNFPFYKINEVTKISQE